MATKSKHPPGDDDIHPVELKIPPKGAIRLPHHLPERAWARFFLLALERLQRAKPGWAAVTRREFGLFATSWGFTMRKRSLEEQERWMDDVFAQLRRRRSFRATTRWLTGPTDRWLLFAPRLNAEVPKSKATAERRRLLGRVPRRKLSRKKASNPLEVYLDELDPPRPAGRPRRQ